MFSFFTYRFHNAKLIALPKQQLHTHICRCIRIIIFLITSTIPKKNIFNSFLIIFTNVYNIFTNIMPQIVFTIFFYIKYFNNCTWKLIKINIESNITKYTLKRQLTKYIWQSNKTLKKLPVNIFIIFKFQYCI